MKYDPTRRWRWRTIDKKRWSYVEYVDAAREAFAATGAPEGIVEETCPFPGSPQRVWRLFREAPARIVVTQMTANGIVHSEPMY